MDNFLVEGLLGGYDGIPAGGDLSCLSVADYGRDVNWTSKNEMVVSPCDDVADEVSDHR